MNFKKYWKTKLSQLSDLFILAGTPVRINKKKYIILVVSVWIITILLSILNIQSDTSTLPDYSFETVTDTVTTNTLDSVVIKYRGEVMKIFNVKSCRIVAADSSVTAIFLETR